MSRRLWIALSLSIVVMAPGAARAADDAIDITPYREKMRVLTDGKGHFITLMPFTISDGEDSGYMFYSADGGKTFYAQRRSGGGRSGNESFDTVFWEPRVVDGWRKSLGFHDNKWTVQCADRKTELKRLENAEGAKMLAGAKFLKPRWKRQAYALARDNEGTYYFVDRAREPEGNKDFRVFKGQRGNLKLLKMVNIVSDPEGDIFITKDGQLRLVLDRGETSWIKNNNTTKLVSLDLRNDLRFVAMVYGELGVYAGEAYGTPCDDM
jgi:hypothetical protein